MSTTGSRTLIISTIVVALTWIPIHAQDTDQKTNTSASTPNRLTGGMNYGIGLIDKEHTDILSGRLTFWGDSFGLPDFRLLLGVDALHVRERNWVASTNVQLGWSPYIVRSESPFSLQWHATVGGGMIDLPQQQLIQVLAGFEAKYDLVPEDRAAAGFGFQFVAIGGYGYDFCQEFNQEFLNVGLAFDEWLRFTFDFASLWRDASPIINAGRLR